MQAVLPPRPSATLRSTNLRTRHLARRLDHDVAGHADQRFDVVAHLCALLSGELLAARRVGSRLHFHRQGIERSLAREYQLVVRGETGKIDEDGLDLRGIDVDAADDQHVVVTSGHAHEPHVGAAACARLVVEPGDVPRAIAHERQRVLRQRGDHQLAGLADRHRLERVRIDDLEQEMILPAVQARLLDVTFAGDARAHHFRKAVNVHRRDAELILERAAHRFAPRLGPEYADAQRQLPQIDAHCAGDLGDVERIRRGRAQHIGREVAQQHHLPLGAAPGNRHHGASQPLGAVMGAEPAGEQPVAVGVVHDVSRHHAGARERTRHQLAPAVEVAAGVADDGRLAGGAGGGVQTQQLPAGHGEHAEWIGVAQVGLRRERKPRDVGERDEVGRLDAGLVELAPILRDVGVGALERLSHPARLQCGNGSARHGFRARIEQEDLRPAGRRLRAHRDLRSIWIEPWFARRREAQRHRTPIREETFIASPTRVSPRVRRRRSRGPEGARARSPGCRRPA